MNTARWLPENSLAARDRAAGPIVLVVGLLLTLAGRLPAQGQAIDPSTVDLAIPPMAQSASPAGGGGQPPPASRESFLELMQQIESAEPPTGEAATSVTLGEGVTVETAPTTVPAWLSGPSTGTVLDVPLPLALEDCVALALEHNFGLQSSTRDVLISQSSYKQERYEFVPFVNLFSGYTFADSKTGLREGSGLEETETQDFEVGAQVQQNFPTGGDLTLRNTVERSRIWEKVRVETVDPVTGRVTDVSRDYAVRHEYDNQLDVTLRQPLLRGGGLKVGLANLRLARLDTIDAALTDQIRRRDLALSVIRTYLQILQRQLAAGISVDALREREDFHRRTMELARLGEIAQSETSRTQVLLLNEEQNLRLREQQFYDSLDRLLVLMGIPLDTPMRLREFTGRVVTLEELGLADTEACVRRALARRPERILSDLAVRRAEIALDVARNGILPFLDLEARYFDGETGPHLTDVDSLDDSRRWSLGALFDLPFPNMANREALRRARLRLEQAEIARTSQERDITEEVRRLARALRINEQRIRILRKSVEIAEHNLWVQKFLLEEGQSSVLDVRQVQDDFFAARTDYNNALLSYQADLAGLYSAIGESLYDTAEIREPMAASQ